jgi:hypothetical protein
MRGCEVIRFRSWLTECDGRIPWAARQETRGLSLGENPDPEKQGRKNGRRQANLEPEPEAAWAPANGTYGQHVLSLSFSILHDLCQS